MRTINPEPERGIVLGVRSFLMENARALGPDWLRTTTFHINWPLLWRRSILRRGNSKIVFSIHKCIECFPFPLRRSNVKKQQSPAILDLRFEENSGKEITRLRHRFEKLLFQSVFRRQIKRKSAAFSNSFGFIRRFFEKLHFLNGLVCTIGLTVEMKLRFQISLA